MYIYCIFNISYPPQAAACRQVLFSSSTSAIRRLPNGGQERGGGGERGRKGEREKGREKEIESYNVH